MLRDIAVIGMPRLNPGLDRLETSAPAGSSVGVIVSLALPALAEELRPLVRVTIGDLVIPEDRWAGVKPKPGTVVIVRVVPSDDVLRNVLSIAVTVAAVALGQFYAPALAGALGVTSAAGVTAVGGAITATTLVAGQLLINALIPPSQSRKSATESPTYSLQGWKNTANPDGTLPAVLGKHRIAPVYAAMPFTEASGDDRYVTAAFVFGYGPLAIRNLRIGDTPIEKYRDVQWELREGYAGDPPLTLYPQQVLEEALSIEIKNADPPNTRYTAADVAEASVDISFPQGLIGYNKRGKPVVISVTMRVRYRAAGTSDWIIAGDVICADKKQKGKLYGFRWPFPSRGRWEVNVERLGDDDPEDQSEASLQRSSRSYWSALRSFRPEYPINFGKPLALAAVRVRATGQLNGTLDEFNADVSCICPDWDAGTQTWINRETQNPASLFRHVLTGPAISYPLSFGELYALEAWHDFCVAKSLRYNRVHDYEASVWEVLTDIAIAGRATPHDRGNAWGVVIDRLKTQVVAHISPRNSWGFQGERAYAKRPDAFRVSFLDETNDFQQAERVIPFPGFIGDPVVAEKLEFPGKTDPAEIWRETRRRQYELEHRPDTYTANQDFEALQVERGDLAVLSHDVLERTQVAGRVKSVIDGMVALDQIVVMEHGKTYACRFRRKDGATLLRTVRTVAGGTDILDPTGDGDLPEPGDLALFGPSGRETFNCIVKGVERLGDLAARLTLIDHAPQIEQLVDQENPPPWDGRVGGEVESWTAAPVAPVIASITSGREAAGAATDSNPYPVVVVVRPGPGNSVPLASFVIRHRLAGAPSWSAATANAGSGSIALDSYAKGDALLVEAYAVSIRGTPGDIAGAIEHTVGASDPDPLHDPLDVGVSVDGNDATVMWTQSASPSARFAQIFRSLGSADFDDSVAEGGLIPSWPNTVGVHVIADLAPGTHRFWVIALDDDDPPTASGPSGPAVVTVS